MLLKLTFVDLKLYLRNWIATFFTLAFPLLMLFLFGSMYGNSPSPVFGGYGSMDVTIPGYIASIIIGTTGLMSLPMELVTRRQQGVLRRFRASPLPAAAVLGSQLLVNLLMALIGAALLVGGGILVYHIHLPSNWLPLLPAFGLCCMGVFAMGFIIASLVHTASAARAISMLIFYPMMFLSGGTLPLQFFPKGLQQAAQFIPMTQVVNLLHNLWFDQGWDLTAVAVMLGLLVVGTLVSARFFKWE